MHRILGNTCTSSVDCGMWISKLFQDVTCLQIPQNYLSNSYKYSHCLNISSFAFLSWARICELKLYLYSLNNSFNLLARDIYLYIDNSTLLCLLSMGQFLWTFLLRKCVYHLYPRQWWVILLEYFMCPLKQYLPLFICFALVSLFNGISTFVAYLML